MITVKVTPNASKNQIMGLVDGVLQVRIKGVPEKGRVNEELIAFLAQTLGIAKSRIQLISGHTSRIKRLKIDDISESALASFGKDASQDR